MVFFFVSSFSLDAERNISRLRGSHSYLIEDLLRDYGPTTARPVLNNSETITVYFSLLITQVIDLVSLI